MSWLSPVERRLRWRARMRTAMLLALGLVLVTALDVPAFHALTVRANPAPGEIWPAESAYRIDKAVFEGEDWYRALRVLGYVPVWAVVAACFVLIDRRAGRDEPWARGARLLSAAVLAGAFAELLKLLIGRERPIEGDVYQGWVVFKPIGRAFVDGSNLGLPSSHTAVALAGCGAIGLMHPAARGLMILIGLGCGLTRMLSGAHWLSDVYVGAIVGLGSARLFVPGRSKGGLG